MLEIGTISLDVTKDVSHAYVANVTGREFASWQITRIEMQMFFAAQLKCIAVLETCGDTHH